MITVHHLENSRSQRILWLLEELALEYDIRRYERDPKTMLGPDALFAVHPLGKSPVIEDDGRVIAESGAIIEYLVEHYDKGALKPARDDAEKDRYRYFMHYAEGSLMPLLLLRLIFDRMSKPPMPLVMRPAAAVIAAGVKGKFVSPRLTQHLDFLETELADRNWFTGDTFTAADVQMSFPLEAAASRGALGSGYPRLTDFLRRAHARPAYGRALERGGPYDYA